MANKFDTDKIKDNNPLEVVIGSAITLKQNGNEFEGLCPFHNEKTPSFQVIPAKGFAFCQGCGETITDVIDWTMKYHGTDFPSACEILGGNKEAPEHKGSKRRITKIIKDIYEGYEPITPVPDSAQLISPKKKTPEIKNPKRENSCTYKPSMVFEYRNAEGMLIGYVLRVDINGAKITPTIMWCKFPDGTEGWCHYAFPEPRTLYGLNALYRLPDAPVLIVEGEKSADAGHRLLPQYVVITWSGGTNGISKSDWTPLRGRNVTIWGDADAPGEKAAQSVAAKALDSEANEVKIITWDKDKPKGWDVADAEEEGLKKKDIISWAKDRVVPWPSVEDKVEPSSDEEPPPIHESEGEPSQDESSQESESEPEQEDPFRALGFNKNIFYYLPNKTQQIMELTPSQHTKHHLMLLAPSSYWEARFPQKNGIDWDNAYEALLNLNTRMGIFDGHDMIRGRGAWIDEGRPVLHMGSKVFIDGEGHDPQSVDSKYIYEANKDLNIPNSKPATSAEANKLMKICEELSWENPLSASLIAGWCVIAPVCGILKWRPHIWVTGAAGSGKTTVIKDVIQRIVGSIALNIEGKTSEAGIRQQLHQDARPIIFDEAESEDHQSAQRMQSVLDLARVASSGGRILKGTVTGSGMSFSVRSCFCFSSINTSVQHYADETRISKIVLKKDDSEGAEDRYKNIHNHMLETFTPEYSARMLARSLKNLRVLQKNCETFVEAAARVLKSRRLADQIGNLLAGTYLCYTTKEITLDEAVQWIEKHDWSDHTAIETKTDEERLVDRIATHRVRVVTDRGTQEATIGELILVSADKGEIGAICQGEADRELSRIGIRVTSEWVYFANRSDPMRGVLTGTPWASEWARPLKDIYNAEAVGSVMYFSPGIKSRATKLPVSIFKES